eukprot:2568761-Amphidinium_carterae.2
MQLPVVLREDSMEVLWIGGLGFLLGDILTDGSALWPTSLHGRRAGWSVVMIDEHGHMVRALYGPLPRDVAPEQTVRRAEDYAVHAAILRGRRIDYSQSL